MSINGTDFRIPQTGEVKMGNWFASHKYSFKLALRYKIGVSNIGEDLVWIQGPYPAGRFNDIAIFNKVLRHFLEPGERVEADNGYVGTADKIKCPDNPCNPVENEGMQSRTRYRHETINGRFKTWGILQQTYRHDIRRHGEVFRAIAIMTQLVHCLLGGGGSGLLEGGGGGGRRLGCTFGRCHGVFVVLVLVVDVCGWGLVVRVTFVVV